MDRAFSNVTIKAISEDKRELEGWATTPTTDRIADQVMPEGAQFDLPLPFLLDHDHTQVVGEVYKAQVSNAGIRFWARIQKIAEPGVAKDLVDYAWSLIKNGLRSVCSIGFRPLEWELLPGGGQKFTSWEWYELSAVGVAANPEARITATKAASAGGKKPLRSPPGHISVAEHERRARQLEAAQWKGLVRPAPLKSPPGHISVVEHERRRKWLNAQLVRCQLAPRRGVIVTAKKRAKVVRLGRR